jgi:hypothetical protein
VPTASPVFEPTSNAVRSMNFLPSTVRSRLAHLDGYVTEREMMRRLTYVPSGRARRS